MPPEGEGQFNPEESQISEEISQEEFLEKNPERELTPEEIERVMKKVQDINSYGIAFTRTKTDENSLKLIFSQGLLGLTKSSYPTTLDISQHWKDTMRQHQKPLVYFNITGRDLFNRHEQQIAHSFYSHARHKGVALLFDLSKFKEKLPTHRYEPNELSFSRSFAADEGKKIACFCEEHSISPDLSEFNPENPNLKEFVDTLPDLEKDGILFIKDPNHNNCAIAYFNSRGDLMSSHSEFGFVLTPRVAPRFFIGVVINQIEPSIIFSVMCIVDEQKPEKLIPIYNSNGDLLWPKQMSYEEVKEFVAERERKKKEVELNSGLNPG